MYSKYSSFQPRCRDTSAKNVNEIPVGIVRIPYHCVDRTEMNLDMLPKIIGLSGTGSKFDGYLQIQPT